MSSNKREEGNTAINHENHDHRYPVVHSQVKKIIQESEKDVLEWLQPEIMRGHAVNVRDQKIFARQHSRSRLGQPIISSHHC